jgi:hypothetical protein
MTQIGRSLLTFVSHKTYLGRRFLKLVPVNRLCEKYLKARKSAKISKLAFDALSSTADRDLVQVWKEQEAAALAGRNSQPESMDIYDIKIHKGLYH